MAKAFTDVVLNDLLRAATALQARVEAYDTLSVSNEELSALIVPAKHRKMLREASKLVYEDGEYTDYSDDSYMIKVPGGYSVEFTPNIRHLYPRNTELQPDADRELLERVTAWAERRSEMYQGFSTVHNVLLQLNERCKSAQVLRFMWPAVLSLCRSYNLNGTADKLAGCKPPQQIPSLPVELRQNCKIATRVVTGAMLLSKEAPKVPEGDADVRYC